tara:strand:+ start:286 stop:696 length:411 start_codon:yes stop_codon:yes gene_type:complete
MAGLSPKLPLARSNEDGYWALNKTILETTKQNFKSLLLTNPGERIMDPFFGVGLLTFLFDQQGGFLEDHISAKIHEQINTYLPHIRLTNIQFMDSSENEEISSNSLVIRIFYNLIPLSRDDILDIKVDPDALSFTA